MTDRIDPAQDADERTQLFGYLDYQRATLLMKTDGLTAEQLATTLPPSTMTLGGMLKHLALVEDNWLSVFMLGQEEAEPWRDVDWEADEDWDWHSAAQDHPDDLRAALVATIDRCRSLVDGVPLEQLSVERRRSTDQPANLRWITLHLIEEYARHNGHADLIRESIDGAVGE